VGSIENESCKYANYERNVITAIPQEGIVLKDESGLALS
jgi:hypothetical protein